MRAIVLNVKSAPHLSRNSFSEQMRSHLKVDGIAGYLAAAVRGIGDGAIRRTFFTREMLHAARHFLPYVGYGIYVGRKPSRD